MFFVSSFETKMDSENFTQTVQKFAFLLEAALEISKAKSITKSSTGYYATLTAAQKNSILTLLGYYADLLKKESESGTLLKRWPVFEAIPVNPADLPYPDDSKVVRSADSDRIIKGAIDVCAFLAFLNPQGNQGFSYTELFIEENVLDSCTVGRIKEFSKTDVGIQTELSTTDVTVDLLNRLQIMASSRKGLDTAHSLLIEAVTKDIKGLEAALESFDGYTTQTMTANVKLEASNMNPLIKNRLGPLRWFLGVLVTMDEVFLQKFYESLGGLRNHLVDAGRKAFTEEIVSGLSVIDEALDFKTLVDNLFDLSLLDKDTPDLVKKILGGFENIALFKLGTFAYDGSKRLKDLTQKYMSKKTLEFLRTVNAERIKSTDKGIQKRLFDLEWIIREFLKNHIFTPDSYLLYTNSALENKVEHLEEAIRVAGGKITGSPIPLPGVPKGAVKAVLPAFGSASPRELAVYAIENGIAPFIPDVSGKFKTVDLTTVESLYEQVNKNLIYLLLTKPDEFTKGELNQALINSVGIPLRLALSYLPNKDAADINDKDAAIQALSDSYKAIYQEMEKIVAKIDDGKIDAIKTTLQEQEFEDEIYFADGGKYKPSFFSGLVLPISSNPPNTDRVFKVEDYRPDMNASDRKKLTPDDDLLLANEYTSYVAGSLFFDVIKASKLGVDVALGDKTTVGDGKIAFALAKVPKAKFVTKSKAAVPKQKKSTKKKDEEDTSIYEWGTQDANPSFELSDILGNGNTTPSQYQW